MTGYAGAAPFTSAAMYSPRVSGPRCLSMMARTAGGM